MWDVPAMRAEMPNALWVQWRAFYMWEANMQAEQARHG